MKYHITINSFYISIDKIRYRSDKYIKANISYYSKSSGEKFTSEKSVKLMKDVMKHWEKYDN